MTSRDLPDTIIQGALNAGRPPFHCYGRGDGAHALAGGEMDPAQSLRQGCGRDRKTHNVKAATFARVGGPAGMPVYQQVFSSALYGRQAMKDFDDYIRTDHRVAVAHGEDPLTRVAWPPNAAAAPAATELAGEHSFHQAQAAQNREGKFQCCCCYRRQ